MNDEKDVTVVAESIVESSGQVEPTVVEAVNTLPKAEDPKTKARRQLRNKRKAARRKLIKSSKNKEQRRAANLVARKIV
jgi:hypothetical protein